MFLIFKLEVFLSKDNYGPHRIELNGGDKLKMEWDMGVS